MNGQVISRRVIEWKTNSICSILLAFISLNAAMFRCTGNYRQRGGPRQRGRKNQLVRTQEFHFYLKDTASEFHFWRNVLSQIKISSFKKKNVSKSKFQKKYRKSVGGLKTTKNSLKLRKYHVHVDSAKTRINWRPKNRRS